MYDKADYGYANSKPPKSFYDSESYMYFITNVAIFTVGDIVAFNINMHMVVFHNDKNAREDNG